MSWRFTWGGYGVLRELNPFGAGGFTGTMTRREGEPIALSKERLEEAMTICAQRASTNWRQLETALYRWNRSKDPSQAFPNQLIELRISLEALYAGADGPEVRFRQAAHGALHLGNDYEERLRYRDLLKKERRRPAPRPSRCALEPPPPARCARVPRPSATLRLRPPRGGGLWSGRPVVGLNAGRVAAGGGSGAPRTEPSRSASLARSPPATLATPVAATRDGGLPDPLPNGLQPASCHARQGARPRHVPPQRRSAALGCSITDASATDIDHARPPSRPARARLADRDQYRDGLGAR